jgi:uncharacterized protein DUF3291
MPRIAVSSVTVLKHVYGHPALAEYEDLIPRVFQDAETARGFIARAKPVDNRDELSNFEREWGPWGTFCAPRFYTGGRTYDTDHRASILALFIDLESLHEFAFAGRHRHVLRHRRAWVVEAAWRSYAIWWVGDDEIPMWQTASDRINHINDHGPTPYAFDFHHPYDADGRPMPLRAGGSAAHQSHQV